MQNTLSPPVFEPLTSQSTFTRTNHCTTIHLVLSCCNRFYISSNLYLGALERHSKMINESVKKSLEKSKNVLAEKRKIVKQKNCIKNTHTFTIISMNFVQEQLLTSQSFRGLHINTASTIKLIHKKRNHQEINFFGPNRAIYMHHSVGNISKTKSFTKRST